VSGHTVGTREEWRAARVALLEREKELTRLGDELARQRQELPWVRVEKEYPFETADGPKTLAELFGGRSQLLVYHFMFGPEYTAGGCPTCSSIADNFDGVHVHLSNHDVTFLAVSRAPLEEIQAFKRRMGWRFPWVSSHGTDFNFDFGVSFTREQVGEGIEYNFRTIPGEALASLLEADSGPVAEQAAACGTDPAGYLTEGPGMSAFAIEDSAVYHTYSTYARGAEFLMYYYPLLDRAPKGRNEPDLWIRRHDEYS
jgi:predicted dithiol-disulfide oxidoreductase (DUF899 family)